MNISLDRAASLLLSAKHIVLSGHVQPDGDCLGSILALYQALKTEERQVQIWLDDDISPLYEFLPYIDIIRRPNEQLCTADLLVVLDASDAERIGRVREAVAAPLLNIDHHLSNTAFADYLLLDTQAAATGELVFQLLEQMAIPLTPDIAVCLYTAIATDCGFFRYANTTPATLRYAAVLMEQGARPHWIAEQLETKSLSSMLLLGKVLQSLEFFQNGAVSCITLPQPLLEEAENTEGYINYPRCIEGVEVAVMFKEKEENVIRVSMRSKILDVSRIAFSFGGGGHMRAAGCTINEPLAVAKAKLLERIEQALAELDQ